jgi:hypothetical protein
MGRGSSRIANLFGFLLLVALLPLLIPLIVAKLALLLTITLALYIRVWMFWHPRGKDILFVYSDSPIWHDYLEQQLLPQIEARSVVLNWSERRFWLHRWSLPSLVFRHFGGDDEFNPLIVYFPPLRRHRTFRFWQAFKDYKHGHPQTLKEIEEELFDTIGLKRQSADS